MWCLRIVNADILSDYDPSGLVWRFPRLARPSRVSFRCRPSASRLYRCGGVFALAGGLGNDMRLRVYVRGTHVEEHVEVRT